MYDTLILGTICVTSTAFFAVLLHLSRKRGEDCPRYPYDCMYCRHAPECMDIIARKNRKERENAEEKKS